nr:PREDICTED: synaptic vesicle 2-related protein-like [Linepithema humile]
MTDNYEAAIAGTGWGLWHYFLIILCGLISLAEASTSLTVPIVAPIIACDLKLSKDQAIMPIAISSLGMAIGAFVFGSISDTVGRKNLIPVTMGIVFCASASLSFAQTNFLINLSVFVLGLGVAGNNTVLRVYLIECLPMRKRGTCLAIIDMFWMIGYALALGVSWALMPSVIRMLGKKFRPSSWRVLAALYGMPSLVIACMSGLLPPSPRHSIYRRRPGQALAVLRQMYAINNSKHADTYPKVLYENLGTNQQNAQASLQADNIVWNISVPATFSRVIKEVLPFAGLALWKTHVLQELENDHIGSGNGTCSVNIQNVALGFLQSCDEINEARFELLLLVSLGYVLGEILLIVGIDVVGRKPYLIFSALVGGAASIVLIVRMHHTIRLVLASIFLAAYAIGVTTTCVLLLENYPTALRGTMIGLTKILPHLTVFAMQLFLKTTCLSSIIVVSIILIGAAIVMLPVADLTKSPMKE